MIAYPDSFPCASRSDGHTAAQFAGLVRSPMEAGNSRQRRSHRTLPHQISLTFVMAQELYADWLAWVNAHAWDEWIQMNLPGLAAGNAGTVTAPILVRFMTDLRSELLPGRGLWYWRVKVDCEWQPPPEDLYIPPPVPPLDPLLGQWNPADQGSSTLPLTFSNTNRTAIRSAPVNSNGGTVRGMKSNGGAGGKFYFEMVVDTLAGNRAYWAFGMLTAGPMVNADPTSGGNTTGHLIVYGTGTIYAGIGSATSNAGTLGRDLVNGDVVGLAWTVGVQVDIYLNGVLTKTVPFTQAGPFFPWFGQGNTLVGGVDNTPGAHCTLNAQRAQLAHAPPAGFVTWGGGDSAVPPVGGLWVVGGRPASPAADYLLAGRPATPAVTV